MAHVSKNYNYASQLSKFQIYGRLSKFTDLISQSTEITNLLENHLLFTKISLIHSAQCPKISNILIDSNRPKEPKSNLHFVKNLTNRPKSSIKVSNQNTLRQKLVQKSICNFLSCSTHSPHQNPIKILPKFIQKSFQKSKFPFGLK